MRHQRPAGTVKLSQEPITHGIVEYFGGPRGSHALAPLNICKAILSVGWIFLAFGYLSKANCAGGIRGEDGVLALNWNANRQYTSFCYNDIVPLFSGRGLDQPGFVYAFSWQEGDLTRYMEYPVLAGLFQGVMGWLTRHTGFLVHWANVPDAGWYFALTALVLSILWVATLSMVAELAGNRAWDALLVAASPLVVIHAFTNWDIPSITFAVAALLAVKRGHTVLAGLLIGLGTAFKLWPVFMLGAFLVLAVRNRRWIPFVKMLATAAVAWILVNAPIAYLYPAAWAEFYRLNSTRGWEWTTIYAMLTRNLPIPVSVDFVNTFSLVMFLVSCVAIGILGLKTNRTPRVAEMVYLILVAFLIFNKVWSPQYSLWLLIPAVLALPRWRLILAWGFFDALVWPILMWHMMGEDNKGVPHEMLDIAILLRDGFILAIAVLVIRQMLGKQTDKVLAANGCDLLAGEFAVRDEGLSSSTPARHGKVQPAQPHALTNADAAVAQASQEQ